MPSKTPHLKGYLAMTLPNEMIDFWLGKLNPLWSVTEKRGKLIRKVIEAKNSVTLYFKTNRNTQLPRAGQHLDLSVEINGRLMTRSYSPTFIDRKNSIIGITVKKVTKGIVSNWLTYALRIEDIVEFGLPYGDFKWPLAKEPVLLIAGGSGITPFISLLREHIALGQPIELDYWCKTREEACFTKLLLDWQQRYPHFKFYLHLTQEEAREAHEKEGRIGDTFLSTLPNLSTTHVLACGPAPFIKSVQSFLEPQAKTFAAESFSPMILEDDSIEEGDYNITLLKQNKTIPVIKGTSILTSLLENNISHPYGCRIGICKSCCCRKVSGKSKSTLTLETDDEENPSFRVCTEYAKSDIVLDI